MSSRELLEITPRHREIIRLKAVGYTNIEIALMLGVTPTTVGNVLGCQLGRYNMSALQEKMDAKVVDPVERLKSLQGKAVDKLEEVLENKAGKAPIHEQLRAAENILDRGSCPRVQKQQTEVAIGLLEVDLEDIKRRVSKELAPEPAKFTEV